MSLEREGTFVLTPDTEQDDLRQVSGNLLDLKFKSWPNKAGFEGVVEHRGPIELKVQGRIPAFAAGTLYRTGPGDSKVETNSKGTHYISHWFDGLARLMAFEIKPAQDGSATVSFSSRDQSVEAKDKIRKDGWRSTITFGQKVDPCVGVFSKLMSSFDSHPSVNNVAVMPNLGGISKLKDAPKKAKCSNMFTTTDNAMLQEVDPDTLEPVGYAHQSKLHPELSGRLSCAHSQRDPETGDSFNYNLDFGRIATYKVFRNSPSTGKTEILATIKDAALRPAYIHSFFLTKNYVVLCVPVTHYGWNGLKIPWERSLLGAIEPFDKKQPCRWIVVDRRHGKGEVARFETPAGFFFHSVNAFEEQVESENGEKKTSICMDLVEYDNTDIIFSLFYDVILNRNGAGDKFWKQDDHHKTIVPYLRRYRFDLPSPSEKPSKRWGKEAKREFSIPSPHSGELPTINPALNGKPYRYAYSIAYRGLSVVPDCIVKTDLKTKDALVWAGPSGHSPGEPVFVPRPGGTDEDDGVVLSLVLDGHAERSYLLCLDPKTMEEMGRAEADFAIAMNIHGTHIRSIL